MDLIHLLSVFSGLTVIDGPSLFKALFKSKYPGFVGNLSYEIYLWHVLILYLLNKTVLITYFQGTPLFWVSIFFGGGITLAISYASVKLVAQIAALRF